MKVISKIAIVLTVGLLVSAGMSNVYAVCGATQSTTFTSNYFDAPVGQDPASTRGVFWGIGQYDPLPGVGTDNGLYPSSEWLRYTPGSGFYIAGEWAGDVRIDNCIQGGANPQPARMGVAWATSDGITTYFTAMCAKEDPNTAQFDTFLQIPGQPMAAVPRPRVTASSRSGNQTTLTACHEPVVGGIFNQPGSGCTLTTNGFRSYYQVVPRNGAAPTQRPPTGGWILLGTAGNDASCASGVVTCAVDSDIYLSTTLRFDVFDGVPGSNPVELGLGSANGLTKVECGPNLATPNDDNFRIIRKPRAGKTR